jgi:hypothetical protein
MVGKRATSLAEDPETYSLLKPVEASLRGAPRFLSLCTRPGFDSLRFLLSDPKILDSCQESMIPNILLTTARTSSSRPGE